MWDGRESRREEWIEARSQSSLNAVLAIVGLLKAESVGGWVSEISVGDRPGRGEAT